MVSFTTNIPNRPWLVTNVPAGHNKITHKLYSHKDERYAVLAEHVN
jgi:hypothetical protein